MINLDTILDDCLARLEAGESLESCLARYPEQAAELRRLLSAASALAPGRRVQLSPQARARGRAQLVAHMRARPRKRRPPGLALFSGGGLRLAVGLSALCLAVLALGTGAAQAALPGQLLYEWKLASEQVWRAVAPDPLAADLALAQRRADELSRVAGDPAAEALAREAYAGALASLAHYTAAGERQRIGASLADQQSALRHIGIDVPQLNDTLDTLLQTESAPTLGATLPLAATEPPVFVSTATASASPTQPPSATRTSTPTATALIPSVTSTLLPTDLPIPAVPAATLVPAESPPVGATTVALPPEAPSALPALTDAPTSPIPTLPLPTLPIP